MSTRAYKHWRDVKTQDWPWANFSPEEIACRGDGSLVVDTVAMDRLQGLRTRLGKPMIINSAYRSPEYNKRVGGKPGSMHLEGKAFDVSMANFVPADFESGARVSGFKGIGQYPKQNFMHIDIGPARTWNDGSNFPSKSTSQTQAVPGFTPEKPAATVGNSIFKPEVLVPVGTAIGASGLAPAAASNGPVAWAIGLAIVVAVAIVAGILIRKNRQPKLGD